MKLFSLKNTVLASLFGLFMLVGGADAQNQREEYNEWQRAQRQAQEEYQDYLRSRSRIDYRDWQQAQRRAQQEYREYQLASRTTYNAGSGYGYGYGRANMNRGRMYRINRNGSYYETDSRGAELLRQAVNSGYQQGYQQGQVDRRYGRNSGYYGNNVYRVGTYGYQSFVDRNQYQYYFQQGFQRGYQDGYSSRTQYGYRSGNRLNILGSVLNTILNIAAN